MVLQGGFARMFNLFFIVILLSSVYVFGLEFVVE